MYTNYAIIHSEASVGLLMLLPLLTFFVVKLIGIVHVLFHKDMHKRKFNLKTETNCLD